mmetsp:Transcript_14960/g.20914  ORF Transcript_14960/g.20914 Transcript_14960/m.20914 type:complete len:215 (+) Transcript_14960:65-709(+)
MFAPVSNPGCVVVQLIPVSCGVAAFDSSYSPLLSGRISQTEYTDAISRINAAMGNYGVYAMLSLVAGFLGFAALAVGMFAGFASGAGPSIFALFVLIIVWMVITIGSSRYFSYKQMHAIDEVLEDINRRMAELNVRWNKKVMVYSSYSHMGSDHHHRRTRTSVWLEIELGPVAPSYPQTYAPMQPTYQTQPAAQPAQPYYPYPNYSQNQPLLNV